jgi:type I restriction enzyme S subunit
MSKLPEGWEIKRLDEIADIVMGQSPPGSSYNEDGEGQPFFQGKTEFGEVHPTVRKYTTAGTKFAKAGDILMSVRAPVGPTNIADIDCVIGRGLAAIRAKPVVSQSYLRWSLKHLEIDIQAMGTGTTFDAITGEKLRGTLVALPPISDQQQIVELLEDHLSHLDAALTDVKQAKIKAAQFRRALLQDAFIGNLSEKTFHERTVWPIFKLGDLCTFITDGSHNPPKGIDESEFLMLSSRDIQNGKLTFEKPRYLSEEDFMIENKRTDLQVDDVLLTTVGTIGRTAIYDGKPKNVTFQRSVSVLRPNKEKVSSKFLMYFLDSITELLNREARGVAQQGIYLNQVRKLEVPLPSCPDQLKIVDLLDGHFSRLDASLALADIMERQSSGLRRSLLQAAFTGHLIKGVVSV